VGAFDLPFSVHQDVGHATLQHAETAAGETRGMLATGDAAAAGFDADQAYAGFVQEFEEGADRVGAAAADVMFGPIGAGIMAVLIMISTFGCNNGLILSGARAYYAMASDKLFFRSAATLNKNDVPSRSLWMQAAWASVLCLSGRYGDLLDYVVFAVLIFYVLTIIGIIKLRRTRPDLPRPIKAVGYPILPALYIVIALGICVSLLIYKPNYSWPGLIIVATGVPVYLFWSKRSADSANNL
jgi:APA family basic amino acid/polyamine antiporter